MRVQIVFDLCMRFRCWEAIIRAFILINIAYAVFFTV